VTQFVREHGLPQMLIFDNDPRCIGSASGGDFSSARVRLLWCVGVRPNVIPPHRPDKNAYVEQWNSSSASGVLAGAAVMDTLRGLLRSRKRFSPKTTASSRAFAGVRSRERRDSPLASADQ